MRTTRRQKKSHEYFLPIVRRMLITRYFNFVKQHSSQVKQLTSLLRLRKLAATCECHDTSREIKLAVIQNCLSKRLRKYALCQDKLKLDDLLTKARILEASKAKLLASERFLHLKR